MKSFQHLRNPWLQLHFLLWFVVYYAGSNFFTHTHQFEGRSVVHSHPFNDSNGHKHTTAEFSVISALTHFIATTSGWVTIAGTFRVNFKILASPALASSVLSAVLCIHFLRPPPLL